jgi:rRNA maturation RNase YbeY
VVSKVMAGENCGFNEIMVNFISKNEIRKINRKFLDHNYFTDIITFPYDNNRKSIEGELFISPETVKENGEIYNSGFKGELERVIIHGCLHLTGYKDRTKKEKELIRAKENSYLSN